MARYWISWVQPTEDHRPLTDPPNENVLGWWCSGEGDSGATLCAVVSALSESLAKRYIIRSWPEAESVEWRFCNLKADDFVPGDRFPTDRFPTDKEWMKKRFGIV